MWAMTIENCDHHRQFVEMFHRWNMHRRPRQWVLHMYEAWFDLARDSITATQLSRLSGCLDGSLCDLFVMMAEPEDGLRGEFFRAVWTLPTRRELDEATACAIRHVQDAFSGHAGPADKVRHFASLCMPSQAAREDLLASIDEFEVTMSSIIRSYLDGKTGKKTDGNDPVVPEHGDPVA
jgi:hypothetical protein